jgi:transglutaminase-like putative cysteine protease
MKRIFFLSLLSLFLFKPVQGQTEKQFTYHISPFVKNKLTVSDLLEKKAKKNKATPYECTSYDELVELITERSKLRDTSYTVHLTYDFLFTNMQSILQSAIKEAITSDDYLNYSYKGFYCSWYGYNGNVSIDFTFDFHTTRIEEHYVTVTVANILGQIITDGMSDLEKEKAVHDWVVTHVNYDYSLTYFSAYDGLYRGKTVCNGYALLMYKMLNAIGMRVRIVPGYGGGELHAWNLVNVCGNWFHVDATWNDPNTTDSSVDYTYYNLSDNEIKALNHTIGTDDLIYSAVPAAPVSFSSGSCGIVTGAPPNKPSLLLPVSGTSGVSTLPTFSASVFSDPNLSNTHWKTLWQISLNPEFTDCIFYDTSLVNLTMFILTSEEVLPDNSTFFWRVKYFDSDFNGSVWSDPFTFTTGYHVNNPPYVPDLKYPVNGMTGASLTTSFSSGEFEDVDISDVHGKTQWQISTTEDFSVPFIDETSEIALDKLSFTGQNVFAENTLYYWRVRYYDDKGMPSGWSETWSFTTSKAPQSSSISSGDEGGSGCFISSSWR